MCPETQCPVFLIRAKHVCTTSLLECGVFLTLRFKLVNSPGTFCTVIQVYVFFEFVLISLYPPCIALGRVNRGYSPNTARHCLYFSAIVAKRWVMFLVIYRCCTRIVVTFGDLYGFSEIQ